MNKFKAAVFDVDWTLLNSEQFIFQAYNYTLKKFKLPPITLKELLPQMGKPIEDCYAVFAPHFDSELLIPVHRVFQAENLNLAIPFPHVKEILKKLKDNNIKIAAVTTRSEQNVHKTLKVTGLLSLIETIIAREDIKPEQFKPHPYPILLALKRLKTKPEYAVTVGDTREDMEAGKRARTKTIGVTYGSLGTKIINCKPDFIVNDISDIIPIILSNI
jgi:pyrophosphatase PpaX